jgi:hypothetical protein
MEANSLSLPVCRATSYVYQPLDDATQSIRLIRLQSAFSFESDVQCEIYHVTLETQPIYEALSYAWGDANVTSPIFLEGCPFQATVNLVSALRYLRHEDKTRTLWVDAICIDQSNVQERGHQVAFMAKIYSMAECDILWLGDDPDDEAEKTFKFIQNMGHTFKNLTAEGKERTKALRAASSFLGDDAPIAPLRRIMSDRPIWKRIWIVQEIVVARNVFLQCGIHSMFWDSLTNFMDLMVPDDHPLWQRPGALSFYKQVLVSITYGMNIDTARIDHHKVGNLSSILDLWSQFYRLQATDSRDKIFALLGLATPTPLGLNSDYTKAPSEIFTMAVRSHIYQTKKLDALCIGHRQQANMALPTWVVDFGSCASMSSPFLRNPPYLASGNTDVSPETFMHPALHPGTLVVSGVQLDTISKRLYTITSDGLESWLDHKLMLQNLPQDILKHRYHTGESMMLALARTITSDLSFRLFGERQRKQESRSLSRDIKSLYSWRGQLLGKLQNSLPNFAQHLLPDSFQKRERRQPYHLSALPGLDCYALSSTMNHFMAMIPDIANEGDILSVLYGSKLPHVLRKVPGKEDTYTLVGTAYVHGFMDGEAIQLRDQGKLKEQRFNLI